MMKNSPIKKISNAARRGTKLAATAAHRGSQFYEQVQTRMAEIDNNNRSPSRHHHTHSSTSNATSNSPASSNMSSAVYRSRVRDQINRFNSVAVSQNNYNNNDDDKTRDNIRQKRDNNTVRRHRSHTSESSKNFIGHANNDVTPPCNPNYYEKENSSNKVVADTATAEPSSSSYSFTSKEGVRALSPTSHHYQQQQRKKSPKKNTSSSPKKTSSASPKKTSPIPSPYPKNTPSNEADNVIDETEILRKHLQALEKDNEKLMKRNARLERKCDKLTRDNAQLKEDVYEAAFNRNDGGSETHHHAHSNNRHRDENNTRNDDRDNQTNKRDPDEHPLIDSPLRKHMKLVHESAESNCTVTMKKAPFPLLPPEQSRAILEARKKEQEEEEGDFQHLDMLGNVTGRTSTQFEVDAKFGYKKRRGKRTKEGSGSRSVDEEEEAVDLLTSAAFMFKTSRRNLC